MSEDRRHGDRRPDILQGGGCPVAVGDVILWLWRRSSSFGGCMRVTASWQRRREVGRFAGRKSWEDLWNALDEDAGRQILRICRDERIWDDSRSDNGGKE